MLLLDAIFRFGGCALLLVIAASAWRYRTVWRSAPYLLLTCISVSALFIGYTLPEFAPPEPILALMRFLDIPHLVFAWLFALSVSAPDFRLQRWHVAVGALYAAPILWPRLALYSVVPDYPGWLPIYGAITSVILIGHLLFVVTKAARTHSRQTGNRQAEIFVVVLLAVTVFAALSDFIPEESPLDWRTAKVIAISPALVFGAIWMLRLNVPMFDQSDVSRAGYELSAENDRLREKLDEYLLRKEAFRDQDLTIASLSNNIGVSQHRLRTLINSELGHPNFNAYLNQIRVEAVCRAFEEPKSEQLPVLTLALDAGFKSTSVFNKAFKSLTGHTPSQYRALLAKKPKNARNPEEFTRNP